MSPSPDLLETPGRQPNPTLELGQRAIGPTLDLGKNDDVARPTAGTGALVAICVVMGILSLAFLIPKSLEGSAADPEATARSRVVERVAKLLALATSANEHEAETAMNAAQRLMLEHNLSDVARGDRRFVSRLLAPAVPRLEEARTRIGGLLSAHFFVEVIILSVWMPAEGRNGRAIEVTGTPENVDMAEYVYAFLDRTADALWAEHKRAHGVRGDRDRRAFRAGVVGGFYAKLEAERGRAVTRGLVWVGDPQLKTHQRARYPRVSMNTYRGSGDASARHFGREAGKKVVLHRGVGGEGGGAGGGGRLLGSGG